MTRFEPARDEDLPAITAYLAPRCASSMFILGNLHHAGLTWNGERYQGEYLLAWDGDAIAGIAGHAWNGMMMVQSEPHAGPLAAALAAHTGRDVIGFTGPADQVHAARAALGLDAAPARIDHDETLLSLPIDALRVPPALADRRVRVRQAVPEDRDTVVPWRAAYGVELSGETPGAENDDDAARWFDAAVAERNCWLVEDGARPVAMSSLNARLPTMVQVGGVYTPPPERNRGYARAAVAASLLDAQAVGASLAILFTPRADALAAYRALGFSVIGRFGVVLLA